MKYILVICLFFLFFSQSSVNAKISFTPLSLDQSQNKNFTSQKNFYNQQNYPKVDMIEEQIFNRKYTNEDINLRLSRIEIALFKQKYPYMSLADRVDNIISKSGFAVSISPNELAIMEQRIFMKTYPNDDVEMRIVRLEKEIFGAMQSGNLNERYKTIKTASKYYNAFPHKLSNQIPYYSNPYYEATRPQKTTARSILKNITDFFSSGVLTGYTPSFQNSYSSYPPAYYSTFNNPYHTVFPNNNFLSPPNGIFEHYTTPYGDFQRNRHYSTGSGVHIFNN